MSHRSLSALLVLLLIALGMQSAAGRAGAQGGVTVFTYQGSLAEGGVPANGSFDFSFGLYSRPYASPPMATIERDDVPVTNGIFVVALDFGALFGEVPRYLEIGVRPGASTGAYTKLTPRQELTAAPVAIYSRSSGFSSSTTSLLGQPLESAVPAQGQVLEWSGSAWAPAADNDTTYAAGEGLGLSGTLFSVQFGGSGSSSSAARSDHTHFGQKWIDSNGSYGLLVENNANERGIIGVSHGGEAIVAISTNGIGVTSRGTHGLMGYGDGAGYGVAGFNRNSKGYAGWFEGRVNIIGQINSLSAGSQIDHPLDPANSYLSNAYVESPELLRVYSGNVTLGADGTAWVQLPGYFDAANSDFRYQLTAIGAAAPELHVAEEISGNRFRLAGGKPGLKVSWEVTGLRSDVYAQDHPLTTESLKPQQERGTYLYPEGASAAAGAQPAAGAPATAPRSPVEPATPLRPSLP